MARRISTTPTDLSALTQPDFAAKRFDDPRYEYLFRAEKGESIEGYCARRAMERAEIIRQKDTLIAQLNEQIRLFEEAVSSGRLISPDSIRVVWDTIHIPNHK